MPDAVEGCRNRAVSPNHMEEVMFVNPYLQPRFPQAPVFETEADLRRTYIDQRVQEILGDPKELADAFGAYILIKPTKCGQVLKDCAGQGTVGHMLELDDILRKAAECVADDEWAHRKFLKEIA